MTSRARGRPGFCIRISGRAGNRGSISQESGISTGSNIADASTRRWNGITVISKDCFRFYNNGDGKHGDGRRERCRILKSSCHFVWVFFSSLPFPVSPPLQPQTDIRPCFSTSTSPSAAKNAGIAPLLPVLFHRKRCILMWISCFAN